MQSARMSVTTTRSLHFFFAIALLLPMVIYYFLLNRYPEYLAKTNLSGMPLSIALGVIVMAWGVFVALAFVVYRKLQLEAFNYQQGFGELDDE